MLIVFCVTVYIDQQYATYIVQDV